MKKRTQALWLTLILIPALPGWTTAKDRLPLGYSSASGVFAGLWVGQEGKIFEKYEFDSHLVLIASGSLMVQAMLGGDLPIAGAAGSAAVDASLGGADIVMFGSMVKVPAFYIMALPEIKTLDDLRGKSVGVTRFGSSTDFTMRYVLRKQGLEPGKDVTLIQTGDIFAAATMLKTKAIVAAPFSSPANLKAEEADARVILNMGKAGRRFLKAYSEAVYRLFTDKELSRRAIARYTRATDAKTLDTVYQYAVDYVDKIPYNTREGIQEVLNQAAVRNPKAKEAKPEAFYDDRFVKELDSQGFYKQLWK
ncbi:MAG: ABC transporter substrate-binding protein [Deltaproteobacteria bacterium]|nr:MAG: ABC transporter substrate-binding protein [Deltaproteobacteria bacterium]